MRLAGPADAPQVELMLRGFLQEEEDSGASVLFTRRTLDFYRDLIWDYLEGRRFGIVVLGELESEAGQEVAGFALAGETGVPQSVDTNLGRQAVVWAVWTSLEHRKSGIGLSMLRFGRPFLVEMGFQTAVMTVREKNPEGLLLTVAFGAKPVETSFHYVLKEEPA